MRAFFPGTIHLPLCLFLAACGARSSLQPGEAAEGGGGNTAGAGGMGGAAAGGGAGAPAGGGGTGGVVVGSCDVLVVDGPPLSPSPAIIGDKQLVPWLAATEVDGSRAALVYVERSFAGEAFFHKASVALDSPWGAWPSGLGTSASHGTSDGFVVGPDREGRFSMLTTDEPNNAGDVPTGMIVWAPSAGVPGAKGQFFGDVTPGLPALVTSNGKEYLAGFRTGPPDFEILTLSRVVFGAGPVSKSWIAACAIGAGLSGAAIPFGEGFLVAMSNGRPYSKCLTDDLPDGPPSRLQVAKLDGGSGGGAQLFEHDDPTTYILQVQLAPAAVGAWVAWERVPFEPLDRRIEILRLDGAGLPTSDAVIEVPYGTLGAPFALASLGPRLAIATTKTPPGGQRELDVHLLAEDGSPGAEITLQAEAGFEMSSAVALLGSPSGGHLLVAWDEESTINNDARRVRLARLACAGP